MNSSGHQELSVESVVRNSVDTSGKMDWKSAFDYIIEREDPSNPDRIEEIGKIRHVLLITLLASDGCKDENIVYRFFEFYGRSLDALWAKIPVLSHFRKYGIYSWQHETLFRIVYRSGTVWMQKKDSQPSWGLSELGDIRYGCPEFSGKAKDFEWIALNTGDWNFVSGMIRYGCWQGRFDRKEKLLESDFKEFWMYMKQFMWHYSFLTAEEYTDKIYDMWHELRMDSGRMISKNQRGFLRIRLIVRTLKAVVLFMSDHPLAKPYLRCLRLFFSVIPDPLVAADEVEEFLLHVMGNDCRWYVDTMMRKWLALFGQQQYMPRILAHMCRSTVRSALIKNKSGVLPDRVELLPLPRATKDFILCTRKSPSYKNRGVKRKVESLMSAICK